MKRICVICKKEIKKNDKDSFVSMNISPEIAPIGYCHSQCLKEAYANVNSN